MDCCLPAVVGIDMEKLDKVREIVGTESIPETISAAFREVIRIAAVRDLVALGETGAFDFLLEPGAEEQMWGSVKPARDTCGPTMWAAQ
jgi:hypothetical protein